MQFALLVITGLPVQILLSSKYDCALRVFLPTSVFQLLLCGSIFFFLWMFANTKKSQKYHEVINSVLYLSTSQADSSVKGCVVSTLLYHLIGDFGFFWRLLPTTHSQTSIPRSPFQQHPIVLQPASKLSRSLWQRGGTRKESLQPRLWNLNICVKKVHAKIMMIGGDDIVMMSLPLAHVFQCLFTTFISASR